MQSVFRAALTAMQTAFPNASVAVIIDGVTGTGLKGAARNESVAHVFGEMGQATNSVRVSMATFTDEPTRGRTILVDGEKVTVVNSQTDNAAATMLIDYAVQQPNEA